MGKTFSVSVLGCKVNRYEAEQIRHVLQSCGWEEDAGNPELIVLHSCAVTAEAVSKVRRRMRRLRDAAPEARLLVTGCCAAPGLLNDMENDAVYVPTGPGWLARFAEELEHGMGRDGMMPSAAPTTIPGALPDGRTISDTMPIQHFNGRHRAFLKIQDGCDIGCSYCIVPRLRGPSRDKPLKIVRDEAAALARNGFREIVVTGVSVGLYGKSGGPGLDAALRALLEVEGLERIRMSSLHPAELTDELLAVWASSPRIMPHVHLPLQSGSDRILKAMNRGYTAGEFLAAVDRARSALDLPAFTTDVIVGFPGETDADFADTMSVCESVGFSRMHIFPFSSRPGTDAGPLGDTVSKAVKKERARELNRLGANLARAFAERQLGRADTVLVEDTDAAGHATGYNSRYTPTVISSVIPTGSAVAGVADPGAFSVAGVADPGPGQIIPVINQSWSVGRRIMATKRHTNGPNTSHITVFQ